MATSMPSGDEWSAEERTVTAWPDGGGFVVRSSRDSPTASDELAADYDASTARLSVSLQASDPTQTSLASTFTILAITEFTDSDGDGRQGLGEEAVRRVEVPGTPAVSSVEALPDGGWRATSIHTLPPPPAALTQTATSRLEVVLEARPQPLAGKDPTRFDLQLRVIDGWARNGTHLAVETGLDSRAAPDAVSADLLRLRDGGHSLATTWQDGRGTVVEGEDPRSVTFVRSQPAGLVVSFPAALSAEWTPSRASDGLTVPGGNVALYLGAAIVAAAAFAYPAWRRLRAA
jgi:hypothetical protein